jgi:hypothetical protein
MSNSISDYQTLYASYQQQNSVNTVSTQNFSGAQNFYPNPYIGMGSGTTHQYSYITGGQIPGVQIPTNQTAYSTYFVFRYAVVSLLAGIGIVVEAEDIEVPNDNELTIRKGLSQENIDKIFEIYPNLVTIKEHAYGLKLEHSRNSTRLTDKVGDDITDAYLDYMTMR